MRPSDAGRDGSSSGSNAENAHQCTGWGASRGETPSCLSCGNTVFDRRPGGKSRMTRERPVRICEGGEVRSLSADDVICHCRSLRQAELLRRRLADRLTACGLTLHPEKTKIVRCVDEDRPGGHPNQKFKFLGYEFRSRLARRKGGKVGVSFCPAVSPEALKAIRQEVRGWRLNLRSD